MRMCLFLAVCHHAMFSHIILVGVTMFSSCSISFLLLKKFLKIKRFLPSKNCGWLRDCLAVVASSSLTEKGE